MGTYNRTPGAAPSSPGASATLADRGNWATTTVYAVGDVVTQSGLRYLCRTAHTAGTFATDLAANDWVSLDGGVAGAEDVTTVASSGASTTLTLPSTGIGTFDVTLTAATVTLTFAGATTGKSDTLTLLARQDATGSRAVTWPGAVTWVGGSAPSLSTAAGAVDVFTFLTVNGGTTWYGFAGSSSSSGWRGRSTGWFRAPVTATSTGGISQNSMAAVPLDVGSVTLSQLAVEITTGLASSTVRLGIYGDSNGIPGSLLVDAGTVDASTTGVKTTGTFSQAVTGRVWLAAVCQGAATATLRTSSGQPVYAVGYDTAANAMGFTPTGYTHTGTVSAALPSTFTVNNATTTTAAVAAKVS